MLVITLKEDENAHIEGVGSIKIVSIRGDRVRVGFEMPKDQFRITRDKHYEQSKENAGSPDGRN